MHLRPSESPDILQARFEQAKIAAFDAGLSVLGRVGIGTLQIAGAGYRAVKAVSESRLVDWVFDEVGAVLDNDLGGDRHPVEPALVPVQPARNFLLISGGVVRND